MTYRKRHDPDNMPPPHPAPKYGSRCVVELTDAEAESVGVKLGQLDWGEKIKPLLVAKGFPAEELVIGNRKVRTFRLPNNITQFELLY